ncbi:phage tail protein [Nocardia abscessus]|uniref:phage tail protein n=1 Tax=Nocardia abscessus TaxID=120957 RepID=UPI002456A8C6|nr:phage tail protein [Nocardia abscessus]
MQTVVELEGVNGEWFTLAGLNEGDRGVYLGTGVTGLYDPPVKVVYEEPGNFPGARYLNHRILRRDIVFGVEILNDKHDSWLSRDSEWRKAWAFDRTCKLYITTQESGTRYLKLALGESPDISLFNDPNGNSVNRAGMVCIAGDPFWYEEDVVYTAVTQEDTTDHTTEDPHTETLYIEVDPVDGRGGLNPTDQYVFVKWILPAPAKWTIPDYSFEDPALANRRIVMPTLITGEDCVVDTDPRVEQVVAENDALVWARMNGVRFRHPIPPYTESKTFEITVSGCAAGQMVALRIPRPWSRPWGLH